MSTFIKLTSLTRNSRPYSMSILVDVNKIAVPIIPNPAPLGGSIIEVDEDIAYSGDFSGNRATYVVSQSLAAIDLLTDEVFFGTLITYNGRTKVLPAATALFVKSSIVDVVYPDPDSAGSKFSYRIMSAKSPDVYTIEEDLDTINA